MLYRGEKMYKKIDQNKMQNFQDDLRNGMGLEDALCKYNLTLKEAFEAFPGTLRKGPNNRYHSGKLYITKRDGTFYIRKTVNGKHLHFGTYRSLADAIKIRDYFQEHGWDKSKVDEVCELLGVTRLRGRFHE